MTSRERPNEDGLIARFFAPLAGEGALGLKDDAACFSPRAGHDLVLTTYGTLRIDAALFANFTCTVTVENDATQSGPEIPDGGMTCCVLGANGRQRMQRGLETRPRAIQRRAQIVRHRIAERLQLAIAARQLGGALCHAPLQIQIGRAHV